MNERSFIVKSYPLATLIAQTLDPFVVVLTRQRIRDKDSYVAEETLARRAARRTPSQSRGYVSFGVFQDLVPQTAATVCDTTGAGCTVEAKQAKGSGVGWLMNWKMAATTLKMHVT
jgi:hypothetical protein